MNSFGHPRFKNYNFEPWLVLRILQSLVKVWLMKPNSIFDTSLFQVSHIGTTIFYERQFFRNIVLNQLKLIWKFQKIGVISSKCEQTIHAPTRPQSRTLLLQRLHKRLDPVSWCILVPFREQRGSSWLQISYLLSSRVKWLLIRFRFWILQRGSVCSLKMFTCNPHIRFFY